MKNLPLVDANGKDFILREELPFPFVHYPNLYGPFLGFSKTQNGPIYFCSCFKHTLVNYIYLQKKELVKTRGTLTDKYRCCLLSSDHFPYGIIKNFVDQHIPESEEGIASVIHFKDGLCHQCNKRHPMAKVNYCNTSTFEASHIWYVKKRFIDIGLWSSENYLSTVPEEYLNPLRIVWNLNNKGWVLAKSGNFIESNNFYKEASRKYTVIHRLIENEVRSVFDYPLVGDRWKEETTLYQIIKQLFPNFTIERHYRPNWLDGLELDIFLPDIPLGIEYQGIQHFQPVKHWGGKEGFAIRKEHDARKLTLANSCNVPIVYFTYADFITIDAVRERLQLYM